MRLITFSTAVLLGSALSTAGAQIGASHTSPSTKPVLQKGVSDPATPAVGVPANNACASAIAISGTGPFAGDNVLATNDGPAACGLISADVWYDWTNGATGGSTTVSFCGAGNTYDTVVQVFDTAACLGASLGCVDDFCGLQSQITFTAVPAGVYKIRVGGFNGATGSFSFTVSPPVPPSGNDACSLPSTVVGLGTFPFNNSSATTGAEGQANGNCLFFGTTGITNDLWFTWNAVASGTTVVETCGQASIDSKIAIYNGAGCPGAGAIACNDDNCGLQSGLSFNAVAGQDYTIQLGNFPTASGGSGTFEISQPPPPGPCDAYHDGSTEDAIGFTTGGHLAWMHKQGTAGGFTVVSSIATAYGTAAFPGSGPPNGNPTQIAIWDDPNDDGNPIDCVLLQLINTTVANTDTDILNVTNLNPPVGVSGVYFIGAGIAHPAGIFPAPWDNDNGASAGRAWIVGTQPGPMNFVNLAANGLPPQDIDSIGLSGLWLLQGTCQPFLATSVCDGSVGCPCGNNGAPGNGCGHQSSASGANMAASGSALTGGDSLVLNVTNQHPSSLTIFWQGSTVTPPTFAGDGLRCFTSLKRLFLVKNAFLTAVSAPSANSLPPTPATVTGQSAAKGDPLAPGSVRGYFAFFRSSSTSFCPAPTGGTFNSTNAVLVVWGQ